MRAEKATDHMRERLYPALIPAPHCHASIRLCFSSVAERVYCAGAFHTRKENMPSRKMRFVKMVVIEAAEKSRREDLSIVHKILW